MWQAEGADVFAFCSPKVFRENNLSYLGLSQPGFKDNQTSIIIYFSFHIENIVWRLSRSIKISSAINAVGKLPNL